MPPIRVRKRARSGVDRVPLDAITTCCWRSARRPPAWRPSPVARRVLHDRRVRDGPGRQVRQPGARRRDVRRSVAVAAGAALRAARLAFVGGAGGAATRRRSRSSLTLFRSPPTNSPTAPAGKPTSLGDVGAVDVEAQAAADDLDFQLVGAPRPGGPAARPSTATGRSSASRRAARCRPRLDRPPRLPGTGRPDRHRRQPRWSGRARSARSHRPADRQLCETCR